VRPAGLCGGWGSVRMLGNAWACCAAGLLLQVHCCHEGLFVLTTQHVKPLHEQHQHQHQHQQETQPLPAGTASLTGVQQAPKGKAKQSKGARGKAQAAAVEAPEGPCSTAATASTSSTTGLDSSPRGWSTPGSSSRQSRKSRQQDRAAAAGAAAAAELCRSQQEDTGADLTGDMSMRGVDWSDVEGQGPFFCPAPRASRSRSSRQGGVDGCEVMEGQVSRGSSSSSRRLGCSSGASSMSSSPHSRQPRMDKGFKRLLRRLLTGFMADSGQREMTFPASLSAADR